MDYCSKIWTRMSVLIDRNAGQVVNQNYVDYCWFKVFNGNCRRDGEVHTLGGGITATI